eukprot:COSAG05_NODE_14087_length_408_cov_1.145631_1_plen_26_part_10
MVLRGFYSADEVAALRGATTKTLARL